MFRKASFFFLFILMFSVIPTIAQDKVLSRYSFSAGLGAEKVGIPFREMVEFPVHSAYYLSVERKWSDKASKSGYQSIDVYLFSNFSAGLGNSIQTSYGRKINLVKNLFIDPSGGIGVIHLFRSKEGYFLESGAYRIYDDRGIIRPELHLGMKLGYSLGKIDMFGSYQASLMYRYGWDAEILPRTFLILGMRYEVRRKT